MLEMKFKKRRENYFNYLKYQCINTLVLLSVIALLFLFPNQIFGAMSISISNLPTEINHGQETEVDLFFSCSGCGDYSYMRGVFYPSGTNYFGFTQNNQGSWIGTENDRALYFSIAKTDLVEASWSGKLKVKANSDDTAFVGIGEYLFKVGRYTSSNDSSADWSNELSVKIIGPTPAPTQAPTTAPTNAPVVTTAPTAQPTAKPSPTKTPTPKSSVTPKPTDEAQETDIPKINLQFGQGNVVQSTFTPEGKVAGIKTTNKSPVLAIILVLAGLGCLGYVGYMIYNMKNEIH